MHRESIVGWLTAVIPVSVVVVIAAARKGICQLTTHRITGERVNPIVAPRVYEPTLRIGNHTERWIPKGTHLRWRTRHLCQRPRRLVGDVATDRATIGHIHEPRCPSPTHCGHCHTRRSLHSP